MSSGAIPPNSPTAPQAALLRLRRRYRVTYSRATVFDALDAVHGLNDLRDDAIIGRIPYGTEFDGIPMSIALSRDLTAHGIEITWPLDAPPHAGVIAYVLPSSVDEITP